MGLNTGKFIPMTSVLSNPESKDVNIVTLSMNPGPKDFLSVTAVAMRGLPDLEPPVGQAVVPAGYNMITWPEELPAAGLTSVIQMPAWLPEDLFPVEIPKNGTNLDANENLQKIEASQKEINDAVSLVEQVCKDVARLTYNYMALSQASAGIVCPLDVTWEVGKRYTVQQPNKDSDGKTELFSGFLTQVTHRVNSSPASPEAVTQLTFSHVEATGFTLPNK
jgi:hypothetical protein